MQAEVTQSTDTSCYHCGNEVVERTFTLDDKKFCCIGCQSVYQILSSNNLCNYYRYNDAPGQTQNKTKQNYEYLEELSIVSQLIDYTDKDISIVTFYIPSIHCSSCIWLLEHLHKLNPGVVNSRIDFLKKEVTVTFRHPEISLRRLVELLVSISYEPSISLQDVVKEKKNSVNRTLIKKIAVAGFCMGNVMLFSFPEYFGLSSFEKQFQHLFGWLNLAFSIPATFYCGREFFTSAWGSLKNKVVNLDAPLALIIAVLFLRTAFEILTQSGPGFADTLTGLVFLLLMGRWVKQRTYYHLSFERDYRSYFPVAVTAIRKGKEKAVAIADLVVGERILIRNGEIIPADAILMKGDGYFDFSFVTGESTPVQKVMGEIVYAGGRQLGEAIEMEVIKPVSQSYLTKLWNNETFKVSDNKIKNFNDSIAKYFSLVVFIIAFSSAGFWAYNGDSNKAWGAFTAVLIVACPCVLALSTPFTLSAVLGLFDKNRFYLKNTDVVEQLARINTMVFDKTGTITAPDALNLKFTGMLTDEDKILVASLARNSMHPLSREIIKWLQINSFVEVSDFKEIPGKGISGLLNGKEVFLGSSSYITGSDAPSDSSTTHVSIEGKYLGYFKIKQHWRFGLLKLISDLSKTYRLHLISGDNENDRKDLENLFPRLTPMRFKQSPQEKLEYIKRQQELGFKVMMLGDGLNDAGALKQSDLGVAVTDDINNFNPGCDAILNGEELNKLPLFIKQAKDAIATIKMSFVIASFYNLIGVYFAIQGTLSPLTAAVLMPISTVTIITFTTVATNLNAKKNKLK